MTPFRICFDASSVYADIVHEHRGHVAQARRAT
jgi:hypothetical protein